MEKKYKPRELEKKWQQIWKDRGVFKVTEDPDKKKYYLLEMFPYPSGKIHMGHVRNYTIGDVVARYKRMNGYNVLHPMGWDSFGMPAENAAIDHKIHPATWTNENIAYMKKQLKEMGFSYDWDRELSTCEPEYYRWEQLFFLWMFEKGLAYKRSSIVNWCPDCKTVLANEQVEAGLCWRCSKEVDEKYLDQWFFRITDYVEELLEYCDKLPGWPERVITMQKNWIGKSFGCEIVFPMAEGTDVIKVFTTRQDTIYGATFMLVAAELPLVMELVKGKPVEKEVRELLEKKSPFFTPVSGSWVKYSIGVLVVKKNIEEWAAELRRLDSIPYIKQVDPLIWIKPTGMDHSENLEIKPLENKKLENTIEQIPTIINNEPVKIDETDRQIAKILIHSSRTSFRKIAKQLNISTKQVIQ
ncbi:MAG: class I tRNA ligase family protein, partial [Syntrophales bacterium]